MRPAKTQISLGVFAVRMKKAWVLSHPLSPQRRLGRCPGWSESSLGAHSFCWFCHVAARVNIMNNQCYNKCGTATFKYFVNVSVYSILLLFLFKFPLNLNFVQNTVYTLMDKQVWVNSVDPEKEQSDQGQGQGILTFLFAKPGYMPSTARTFLWSKPCQKPCWSLGR